MTHRAELNQPTAVERATAALQNSIHAAISAHFAKFHVKHQMTEDQYRRIIALYFHDKSLTDWCQMLGIPVPDGHQEHDHGGEG